MDNKRVFLGEMSYFNGERGCTEGTEYIIVADNEEDAIALMKKNCDYMVNPEPFMMDFYKDLTFEITDTLDLNKNSIKVR